jgi:hypothetical protein
MIGKGVIHLMRQACEGMNHDIARHCIDGNHYLSIFATFVFEYEMERLLHGELAMMIWGNVSPNLETNHPWTYRELSYYK